MYTLKGGDKIIPFVPRHFYEVAMYICSHPANESRFMLDVQK